MAETLKDDLAHIAMPASTIPLATGALADTYRLHVPPHEDGETSTQSSEAGESKPPTFEGVLLGSRVSIPPCYPFSKLAIVEKDIGHAEYDENGQYVGRGLEHEMVDTGRPSRRTLGAEASFRSASSGANSARSLDPPATEAEVPQDPGKSKGRGKGWLLFQKRKEPKKHKKSRSITTAKTPSGRWDIFPGVGETVPESEVKPSAILAQISNTREARKSRVFDDRLAQTFDLRGHDQDLNDTAYSKYEHGSSSEPEEAGNENGAAIEGSFSLGALKDLDSQSSSVKATSRLQVHRFKGCVFINEYCLVSTIGRGSFGEVKLALNTTDFGVYALKLLPKELRGRRGLTGSTPLVAEERVMSEISVMKKLSHPNIVRLVEVIDDPAKHKILMVLEYVEGGSLFAGTRIAPKKRLTELAARKYFRDVLQGLSYLHANKIAHGDLKPDNFLLDTRGHIKIADFGSSQLTRAGHLVRRTTGTPAFMSPEMCAGQEYHARMADVWALGVCLYMFIFGTVPFKAKTNMELYKEICNAPLRFPSDVFTSHALRHLIIKLLDKDPNTRLSLNGVMSHPWVTHNGLVPIPGFVGHEKDIEDDMEAYLLESWPEDPGEAGLGSALRGMGCLFKEIRFADGAFLAREGDSLDAIFYLEQGEVEVLYPEQPDQDSFSDEDEDQQTKMYTREGRNVLEMICEASLRAAQYVSAVRRATGDGLVSLTSRRGPGFYVGEVGNYDGLTNSIWSKSVRAKGPVKARTLDYVEGMKKIIQRPEIEADMRAVMAQRKGELLKLGILEKLAGLQKDVEAALDNLD